MVWSERAKDFFLSGLVLLTPLIISLIVISFLFGWTSGVTNIVVEYLNLTSITFELLVIAQALVLIGLSIFILLIGAFSKSKFGKYTLGSFGRLVNIVPVYRSLYYSIRNLANSITENKSSYKEAVLVEYPMEKTYRIGFVTSPSGKIIEDAADEELVNVYLPNSPNPTNGITVMLPDEKINELEMTVKQGFKLLITTGVSNEKIEEIMPE